MKQEQPLVYSRCTVLGLKQNVSCPKVLIDICAFLMGYMSTCSATMGIQGIIHNTKTIGQSLGISQALWIYWRFPEWWTPKPQRFIHCIKASMKWSHPLCEEMVIPQNPAVDGSPLDCEEGGDRFRWVYLWLSHRWTDHWPATCGYVLVITHSNSTCDQCQTLGSCSKHHRQPFAQFKRTLDLWLEWICQPMSPVKPWVIITFGFPKMGWPLLTGLLLVIKQWPRPGEPGEHLNEDSTGCLSCIKQSRVVHKTISMYPSLFESRVNENMCLFVCYVYDLYLPLWLYVFIYVFVHTCVILRLHSHVYLYSCVSAIVFMVIFKCQSYI